MNLNVADIDISTFNLQLPSGYEARADAIARLAISQLQSIALEGVTSIASLTVPAVQVVGGESDALVARKIATAIGRSIELVKRNNKTPEVLRGSNAPD